MYTFLTGAGNDKAGKIDAVLATIVRKSPSEWTGMRALEGSPITKGAKDALRGVLTSNGMV